MAKPISANIPHSVGKDEAIRRLRHGFDRLHNQLAGGMPNVLEIRERWEGDRLHFDGGSLGQKISGRLDVFEDSITIEVDLPPMLAAFARAIMSKVQKEATVLLEK